MANAADGITQDQMAAGSFTSSSLTQAAKAWTFTFIIDILKKVWEKYATWKYITTMCEPSLMTEVRKDN